MKEITFIHLAILYTAHYVPGIFSRFCVFGKQTIHYSHGAYLVVVIYTINQKLSDTMPVRLGLRNVLLTENFY